MSTASTMKCCICRLRSKDCNKHGIMKPKNPESLSQAIHPPHKNTIIRISIALGFQNRNHQKIARRNSRRRTNSQRNQKIIHDRFKEKMG